MRRSVRSRASADSSFSASSRHFVDELLDDVLAPRAERAPAEAAAKPFTPAKPMPWISVVSPSSVTRRRR